MISNLWIKTCAARYEQKGGVSPDGAIALASACAELQQVENGDPENWDKPERAADEDMLAWHDDEALQ